MAIMRRRSRWLARRSNLAPIGPGIAWLGGRERPDSPLLRVWKVLDRTSADPKRVRTMLRDHDVVHLGPAH